MSKSRKAKSLALLLALAFVFTSLFSSIGAVAFAAEDGTRLGGNNRYETAVEISKEGWATSDDVILASGQDFPDALVAGPLAQALGAPILLTKKDVLPDVTKAEIDRLGAETVYIVGGADVVYDSVADATGKEVKRIFGENRYETAVAVAEKLAELGVSTEKVIIARSDGYTDALAAAAVKPAMPILFAGNADDTSLANATEDAMTDLGVEDVVIVGGTNAVSAAIEEQIDAIVNNVNRVAGDNGIGTAVAIANAFKPADGYKGVALATNSGYADALAGGPYAAKNGYALLLTDKLGNLTSASVDFIKANTTIMADAIVALGGSDVVPEAALTAAKDAATPVAFKVESVSANNLKSFVVNFNKEVDSTTLTADTVKVYINSSTTATTVDTTPSSVAAGQVGYILGEDKKTLSIVFGTALNQSDDVKLVVEGVKTTSQVTVEKYETTLTLTDTAAPVAEKVEVVNNKKVKLYFSEPVNVDTAGIYKTTDVANAGISLKVDGSLSFAKFTPVPEQNAVEVEFFNALADGSHTIEVSDVKDFAGFKASAKSFTINTAADTKAPVATSIEYVSRTQIKVHFDESLKDAGGSTPTGTFEVYEAGNSTNLFSSASLSTDGKTVTITVAPFTVAATVGLDVKYKNVEDIFGNKTTDFVTISGKAEDDAVKPTVSSVEVLDGNVLKVTFSEKVDAAGQTTQFKLYKEDGTTVVASAAASVVNYDTTNPDGKTFKVTFNELTNINAANYKLKVTGTKDISIRQNIIDDVMLPFTARDSKAPNLVTAVLKADAGNNDKIELVFSEAMDVTLLNNVANYFIGNGAANIPLNTISGAKVDSVSADGKKVTLLVPDADNSDTSAGLSAKVDRIAMPALKDTVFIKIVVALNLFT